LCGGVAGCHSRPSVESLYSTAQLKLQQGYLDAALQQAEQGYRDSKSSPLWNWRFRLLEAEILGRRGSPANGLALLQPDPPPDLPLEIKARRKVLLGQAQCQIGQYAAGRAQLKDASELIGTSDRGLEAEAALVRGKCALFEGNIEVAQREFEQAQTLAENTNDFVQASALGNLGALLMRGEHCDDAIYKFQRLLEIMQPMHSPVLEEKTLGNLGYCFSQLGDWKKAISFSQQAQATAAEIGNTGDQEKWLIDLGKAHFALWEFPEAETNYLKALGIAKQLRDRDNTALCFHNLALIALRRNDPDKASAFVAEGKALNSERESLHFALDAADIAAAQGQLREAERLFKELLVRTRNDAIVYSIVEQNLGNVYWHEHQIAQADQMFREGIQTAEKALAEFKRPEDRMSFMDRRAFYDPYIQFLAAQNKPMEALRIAERSRAQVLAAALENGKTHANDPSMSIAALRALAKQRKQIILTYSMTNEKTFLWVITASRFEPLELPGHAEISSQIEACNKEIQDHHNLEDSPSGRTLYQTLVQPAEALVPKGSSVIIVPSKLLSLVNFEALIVPGPQPHYWIEDVDVQVTGSLGLLASAKPATGKSPPGVKELLSIGAPVAVTKDFPTLKHAPEEMQRVQGHFQADQVTIISGKEATPRAYRASDPGRYRFIHLDTHGVASDLSPLDSAIILSPGADNSYKLYAREIKDIPLRADLVTISACYGSGTRWYQGEGLVGLTWAFLRAGVHQVIGALWEVDEASSPQLMDDFYGELTQGKSAAEALRDAKLKMLHSNSFYRHPYYWATLQLYTGS
jgi:CHAT domain-containing protein